MTIGCIPITDEGIKEVYWLAVQVHAAGQRRIPIEIFPAELTEDGFKSLVKSYPNQPELLAFWPQPSSARSGGPPRKSQGIGVLDPPGPPRRPRGSRSALPESFLTRLLGG